MKQTLLLLAGFSLMLGSCKKDTIHSTVPTPVPETSCQCLQENIGVPQANQISCYGFFTITNYLRQTANEVSSSVQANTHFFSEATPQITGNKVVKVDSVSFNQQFMDSVKDVNGQHMYYSSAYIAWPMSQDWQVYGNNGIPSFTANVNLQNPTADFSQLPTQLSKSLLKSMTLNGVNNITRASATLFKSGVSGPNISIFVKAGSNQLCFPSEWVSRIDTGKATLLIELENMVIRDFGNKNFGFIKTCQYTKEIQLNP